VTTLLLFRGQGMSRCRTRLTCHHWTLPRLLSGDRTPRWGVPRPAGTESVIDPGRSALRGLP